MRYLYEGNVRRSLRGRRNSSSGLVAAGGLLTVALLGFGGMTAAHAQQTATGGASMMDATGRLKGSGPSSPVNSPTSMPNSVLLFPATAPSDAAAPAVTTTPTAPAAGGGTVTSNRISPDTIITDAVRRYLTRGGVGVVVYSRRLPSVERAVAEGMKADDAVRGPGDDPRKAQRFATMVGASEYVTVIVDDYKWDPASRTVTFNLSVTRNAEDGTSLGATAQKAVGSAPATILASRQEAFAVASASDVVAEQVVEALYPGSAAMINPPKDTGGKKHRHNLGKALLIPAAAVAAAIIGTNS